MAEWTNDLIFRFLQLYSSEPILYDPKHPHHKNKNMIQNAWLKIQQNLSVDMPVSEIRKKKDSLMCCFRYHLRKRKEAAAMCEPPSTRPPWFAFDYMYSFLGQIYENAIVEESEPILEVVDFDTLDYSSPADSPSTTQDNFENTPQTNQNTAHSSGNLVLYAQNDRFKSNQKEEKLRTALKRKQSADTQQKGEVGGVFPNEAEDDCELFGRLITKKLRKLPEPEKERLMYEIQGLFFKVSQYRSTP